MVISVPPVACVYHPERVYPSTLDGAVLGKVVIVPHHTTTFDVGECPLPPFPSKFTLYPRGALQLPFVPPSVPKQLHVYVPVPLTIALGTPVEQRLIVGEFCVNCPAAPPQLPAVGVLTGGGHDGLTLDALYVTPPLEVLPPPTSTLR